MSKLKTYTSVKKAEDIVLDGIEVLITKNETGIRTVTLADKSGHQVVFLSSEYGSLRCEVPAPPKMVKRYRLHGKVLGIETSVLCDTRAEADSRKGYYEDNTSESDHSDTHLAIEEIEVPEEG